MSRNQAPTSEELLQLLPAAALLRVRVDTGEVLWAGGSAEATLAPPRGRLVGMRLEELRPEWAAGRTRALLEALGHAGQVVRERAEPWLNGAGEVWEVDTVGRAQQGSRPPQAWLALQDAGDRQVAETAQRAAVAELQQAREENERLRAALEQLQNRAERERLELETANRHLEAANAAMSQSLAALSHEIRTPLNAVVGFSELLEVQGENLTLRQRQYLADIRKASEHLLSLVSDLLDLSRIRAGRLEILHEPVALEPLVRGVNRVAEALARPREIKLYAAVPRELGAWGDERRLRQVLFNLISNAVQYSPPETEVRVEAEARGEEVVVSVRDQGPGIAPEHQERVFEEFVRLPQPGGGTRGTGLGLPLSQRLVEAMGGRLTLESEPGEGSVFSFTLPRYEPTAEELG